MAVHVYGQFKYKVDRVCLLDDSSSFPFRLYTSRSSDSSSNDNSSASTSTDSSQRYCFCRTSCPGVKASLGWTLRGFFFRSMGHRCRFLSVSSHQMFFSSSLS
ncbi:hypothetical protein MLD38_006946 [Melastoma candidum]|uniref:Uncharacterized protein n=1 Tax=Melastoma candidum TaxID=119954 RepID=A0ACB9RQW1_9MYRT|nr:hypothetical protein MLD38_006946 [Melastoma candidum]